MSVQSKNKITARKNFYTDIDLNITPHPSSGDLVLKQDKEAVKRSVRNIMLTNNYERPFKPNFGANLRGLLFELADDMTKMEISKQNPLISPAHILIFWFTSKTKPSGIRWQSFTNTPTI